jgi:predicted dehydrogenase
VTRTYELQPTAGYSGFMGKAYVEGFLEAVRTGDRSKITITGEDGVKALEVVEAVYRADAEKRWVGVG